MRWGEFEAACPEIGGMARDRFSSDELVLVGTIRRDGTPRISPSEPDFASGHLFLGMMWRSPKALDLLRDARCVIHSVPSDRWNEGGDIKLYGSLIAIYDGRLRSDYRDAISARLGWAPTEPEFHLFSLDVRQAGYKRFDEQTNETWTWHQDGGFHRETRPNVV
jgi:hypothetical protein